MPVDDDRAAVGRAVLHLARAVLAARAVVLAEVEVVVGAEVHARPAEEPGGVLPGRGRARCPGGRRRVGHVAVRGNARAGRRARVGRRPRRCAVGVDGGIERVRQGVGAALVGPVRDLVDPELRVAVALAVRDVELEVVAAGDGGIRLPGAGLAGVVGLGVVRAVLRGRAVPAATGGVRARGDRQRGGDSRDGGEHPKRDLPSHGCSPLGPALTWRGVYPICPV